MLWRYIRYASGEEELYETKDDPYELTNLVSEATDAPQIAEALGGLRRQLDALLGSN